MRQDFGLRAEVEVPAARKAGQRASRGSSPALVLQLRANDLGDDQALATFWQNRHAGTWATRLPSCRVITNWVVRLDQGSRLGTFELDFGPINVRRRGKDHPDARDRNSPVRVSTLMRTPCSRYSGTCTTKPVSKVAGLVRPVAELPRVAGSQCVTASSTANGN